MVHQTLSATCPRASPDPASHRPSPELGTSPDGVISSAVGRVVPSLRQAPPTVRKHPEHHHLETVPVHTMGLLCGVVRHKVWQTCRPQVRVATGVCLLHATVPGQVLRSRVLVRTSRSKPALPRRRSDQASELARRAKMDCCCSAGSGRSSIRTLKRIPVMPVRADRQFVKSLCPRRTVVRDRSTCSDHRHLLERVVVEGERPSPTGHVYRVGGTRPLRREPHWSDVLHASGRLR